MSSSEAYHQFCSENRVSLFLQKSWMDGSGFECRFVEKKIHGYNGYFIYPMQKRFGLRFLRNPHFTPYTGIVFGNQVPPVSQHSEWLTAYLSHAPVYDVMDLSFPIELQPDSAITLKMAIQKRPTCLLTLTTASEVYQRFNDTLKRQIRKSQTHVIEDSQDMNLFYQLHTKTFSVQNLRNPIPSSAYHRYWELAQRLACTRLFQMRDQEGHILGMCWLVFDQQKAYYLAGTRNAEMAGSEVMAGLLWHAIQFAISSGIAYFDFEGSDHAGIHRFFKTFSPVETSYLQLKDQRSLWYRILKGRN